MIEALMLDVDGVLVNGRPSDGRHWAATLEADLGLSAEALQESFFQAHWEKIVTGRAGLRERLADVLAQIAPTLTAEQVVEYWFRQDARINRRLLRELAVLRRGGLRVYLATNQEHERTRFLMNEMGLGAHVDGCCYSAAIGHRKPAPEFFSAAASEATLSMSQLLLVDDDEKNVQAAIKAGWNAALWTGSKSLTEILSRQECKFRGTRGSRQGVQGVDINIEISQIGRPAAPDRCSGDPLMPRLKFGAFLAPHHPVGENPLLQFRRDLDLVEMLDKLGYDEFWCGEHHSSGWEMIGSPEMFLAAAAERSKRIKLATGVVSLPYHHPFNVAQRMVQLDWMSGGRAIFGSGPGALASDAHTLGLDPMVQRDRQDEAIGVIRRLMRGERVSAQSDWYILQDAQLQLLPLQEEMPFAVASQISPSGMTLAGKHGIGVISIGSMSSEGLNALATQWGFAESAAKKHGQMVDRRDWRVLLSWHIAETREKARAEAREGLLRHHNQYIVGTLQRPGATPFDDPDEAVDKTAFGDGAAATIGTPDDLVARIKSVLEVSGGFGTLVGFVHDWANPENTMRSWDMVARYVVPEINGYLAGLRQSQHFVATNRGVFDRAKEAIMAKITENEAARAALAVTRGSRLGEVASASNMPDLEKARAQAKTR